MIVVYRLDELSHSHPLIQVQSDPLSRRFRLFLIARLELLAKVHAPEAHVMTTTDVRAQLDFPTVVARRYWFPSGTGRKTPTYAIDEHATLRMK